MKKLGIFGGTFNPIHKGHIHLALYLREHLALDEIIVIPTNIPPHKECPDLASARDRLEMCRLACRRYPFLTVSDIEAQHTGASYTYYTLMELRESYPHSQFYLMMGSDMFLSFEKWHRFQEIMEMAVLCAAPREEGQVSAMEAAAAHYRAQGARVELLEEMQVLELSSTEVRRQLVQSQESGGLLDKQVEQYILEKGLYQPQASLRWAGGQEGTI